MPNSEELKPCPFCGTTPIVKERHQGWDNQTSFNITCPCHIAKVSKYEKIAAIAAWNQRANEKE